MKRSVAFLFLLALVPGSAFAQFADFAKLLSGRTAAATATRTLSRCGNSAGPCDAKIAPAEQRLRAGGDGSHRR